MIFLSAGANRIQNGGFESGHFEPWQPTGNQGNQGVLRFLQGFGSPHSGADYAYFGPIHSPGQLSQVVTTTSSECTLSFYVSAGARTTISGVAFLRAFVDGDQVADASAALPDYQMYTAIFQGSGTAQTIGFMYQNDPDFYFLDDVSLTCPE